MKTCRCLEVISISLLSLVLAACGLGSGSSPGGTTLLLKLQFPATLERSSSRYHRFLERAVAFEIQTKSTEKALQTTRQPPQNWENIRLNVPDFPRDDRDVLELTVRAWDLDTAGKARSYPVLMGKKQIAARELIRPVTEVTLRLSLQIGVAEYDRPTSARPGGPGLSR